MSKKASRRSPSSRNERRLALFSKREKPARCEHVWGSEVIEYDYWHVCKLCGFSELFADGMLIRSTDWGESLRLMEGS